MNMRSFSAVKAEACSSHSTGSRSNALLSKIIEQISIGEEVSPAAKGILEDWKRHFVTGSWEPSPKDPDQADEPADLACTTGIHIESPCMEYDEEKVVSGNGLFRLKNGYLLMNLGGAADMLTLEATSVISEPHNSLTMQGPSSECDDIFNESMPRSVFNFLDLSLYSFPQR